MSRPLPANGILPLPDPQEQVRRLAELYRPRVNPVAHAGLLTRTRELGLNFSDDELLILAALDTPDKVQAFLNSEIYYNYDHPTLDHPSVKSEETTMPPRRVLQTGFAHCFEGACFAYAVNFLHGHNPRWILLEASQDSDHNLILYQDPETGLYGVNAHSGYPRLVGQLARFSTLRSIAEYYFPFYISDHTLDPNDTTLVGYSEPIDLVAKYGTAWMDSESELWDMYYTYIDDRVRLHYLYDDTEQTHLYPLIQALRAGWIQVEADTDPRIDLENLPREARTLWDAFWQDYRSSDIRARGPVRAVEMSFFALTGTTPLDLVENAEELENFLERGYRVEQLLTRPDVSGKSGPGQK